MNLSGGSAPAFRAQCTLPPQPIFQTFFSIFPRFWFRDYYGHETALDTAKIEVEKDANIATTLSDLELWTHEVSHVSRIWFGWVDSWCHISWTLQAMDMKHHWIQQRLKLKGLWEPHQIWSY